MTNLNQNTTPNKPKAKTTPKAKSSAPAKKAAPKDEKPSPTKPMPALRLDALEDYFETLRAMKNVRTVYVTPHPPVPSLLHEPGTLTLLLSAKDEDNATVQCFVALPITRLDLDSDRAGSTAKIENCIASLGADIQARGFAMKRGQWV